MFSQMRSDLGISEPPTPTYGRTCQGCMISHSHACSSPTPFQSGERDGFAKLQGSREKKSATAGHLLASIVIGVEQRHPPTRTRRTGNLPRAKHLVDPSRMDGKSRMCPKIERARTPTFTCLCDSCYYSTPQPCASDAF